jgi:DNA mismatch repair protein MutS2
VTTHLGQLKQRAAETGGISNASLAFDGGSLTPTYRLVPGFPGRSYALVIARRLGVPEAVLARAEAFRPEYERSLDALLADVEHRRNALTDREAEADAREARLVAEGRRMVDREASVAEREQRVRLAEKDAERAAREQARSYLLDARRKVEEALALARAAVNEATAKEARRLVEKGINEEAQALKGLEELSRKGWTVGKVGGGKAGKAGPSLRPEASVRHQEYRAGKEGPTPHSPLLTPSEINLLGMTGDEAESAVLTALDAAVLGELPVLRIIHGKGTGALRARVADVLTRDPRVAGFALAPAQQGGSGVTLVEMKP